MSRKHLLTAMALGLLPGLGVMRLFLGLFQEIQTLYSCCIVGQVAPSADGLSLLAAVFVASCTPVAATLLILFPTRVGDGLLCSVWTRMRLYGPPNADTYPGVASSLQRSRDPHSALAAVTATPAAQTTREQLEAFFWGVVGVALWLLWFMLFHVLMTVDLPRGSLHGLGQ